MQPYMIINIVMSPEPAGQERQPASTHSPFAETKGPFRNEDVWWWV